LYLSVGNYCFPPLLRRGAARVPESTKDQLLSELRECYDAALEIIENQRSQLSLALFVLADLGFDLSDFADVIPS